MGLLDGKIAREVSRGLTGAGMTKPATLHVVTAGVRDPGNLAGGTNPTVTTVPCRGLVMTWKRERLNATVVQVGNRVAMLLGATLGTAVPKVGDKVTIEGVTSAVLDVDRDPASAAYLCLLRS